jgi:glycerol uptake operon antiterminator
MLFQNGSVLPAVNNVKNFEKLLNEPVSCIIILDSHLTQIGAMVRMARRHRKHVILHADLIKGLKNDEYAAEYICQSIRPHGVISTRRSVLEIAGKRGIMTILRIFLLDSRSIETSCGLLDKIHPDLIEVLPGVLPDWIAEIHRKTRLPVIAGGLIRTEREVKNAFHAGAAAVSTSNRALWKIGRSEGGNNGKK